jgi:hypothetical protein
MMEDRAGAEKADAGDNSLNHARHGINVRPGSIDGNQRKHGRPETDQRHRARSGGLTLELAIDAKHRAYQGGNAKTEE